jgi:hypothetical protein
MAATHSTATDTKPSNQPTDGTEPVRRGWLRRNWRLLAAGIVVAAIVAAASGYYYVFGRIMLSEPFKRAWDIVKHDQKVIAELGEPIGGGWFPHGTVNTDSNIPEANMNFSISGPKGKADVAALGRKIDGAWGFPRFDVEIDAGGGKKRIDVAADQPSDVPRFNAQQPNQAGPKIEKATPDQDIKIDLPPDVSTGK